MLELWMIPLGFAAGVLGSMIGLGGGMIIVPVLTFLGFPPTVSASNSLFAALANAAASTISYSRQRRVKFSLGLKLGLLSVPGTILGALVSADVSLVAFQFLFGVVLVFSATYIFLRGRLQPIQRQISHWMVIFVISASFFAGIISSFFGIGGGIVFVPLMVAGMAMTVKQAAPTSQFVLLFASSSGVLTHSLLGHPDFAGAGLLAAGSFAGGLVGARLSIRIKERYLQVLVSAVILAAAVKLFLDSVHAALS